MDDIKDNGISRINMENDKDAIVLMNIIGEIEGHDVLPSSTKSTKYEHLLPVLAACETDPSVKGILCLLNTVGGDVEAGLAIAEMIASLSKPVVSLILGGSHSIGVPLAVASDRSFIVPTATMVVHPIRMSGLVLGVKHNFEYIEKMQDRIIDFTAGHSDISVDKLKNLMFKTGELSKDVGSMLVGVEAVNCGLVDRVGGIKDATLLLYDLIKKSNNSKMACSDNS